MQRKMRSGRGRKLPRSIFSASHTEKQQKTLNAKLRGHYQYYGRPTNYRSIGRFFREVLHTWHKWLSRRTRGNGMTWEKYAAILRKHPLLLPRIRHSWLGAGSHA